MTPTLGDHGVMLDNHHSLISGFARDSGISGCNLTLKMVICAWNYHIIISKSFLGNLLVFPARKHFLAVSCFACINHILTMVESSQDMVCCPSNMPHSYMILFIQNIYEH